MVLCYASLSKLVEHLGNIYESEFYFQMTPKMNQRQKIEATKTMKHIEKRNSGIKMEYIIFLFHEEKEL